VRDSPRRDLDTRTQVQFRADVIGVAIDRLLADVKRLRDLPAGEAPRDQSGDLAFARRQQPLGRIGGVDGGRSGVSGAS
jgi:hypothetical protein